MEDIAIVINGKGLRYSLHRSCHGALVDDYSFIAWETARSMK